MDAILDVDPGVDDALAILLALASPELNVLGLTVVNGNVPLDRGVDNALRVVAFSGRDDVRVFAGADRPLVGSPVYADRIHGPGGLGAATLPPPAREAEAGAVDFIAETLHGREGGVTVIALGPLTNLAAAERRSPGVLAKAERVIAMGGAVDEPGNVSPVAEFNFLADPDAARIVVRTCPRLTLVPLDVTHDVGVPRATIEGAVERLDTARATFFRESTSTAVRYGAETGAYAGVYLHDPTAVTFAVRPDLFETGRMHADVEVAGELTTGQLVTDRRPGMPEGGRKGNAIVVTTAVDGEAVLRLFATRVLEAEGVLA